MKTSLKTNVNPHLMTGGIMLAVMVAREVFYEHTADLVITSLNDGRHSRKSLHYQGRAVDLRSKHLHPEIKTSILHTLRQRLGVEVNENDERIAGHYDVLLESLDDVHEHFHIELDPTF